MNCLNCGLLIGLPTTNTGIPVCQCGGDLSALKSAQYWKENYDELESELSTLRIELEALQDWKNEVLRRNPVAEVVTSYVCKNADGKYRSDVVSDERLSVGTELFTVGPVKE